MQGPGISLIHRHQHLSLSLFPLLPPLHLCDSEPSADADPVACRVFAEHLSLFYDTINVLSRTKSFLVEYCVYRKHFLVHCCASHLSQLAQTSYYRATVIYEFLCIHLLVLVVNYSRHVYHTQLFPSPTTPHYVWSTFPSSYSFDYVRS